MGENSVFYLNKPNDNQKKVGETSSKHSSNVDQLDKVFKHFEITIFHYLANIF